MRQPPSPPSNDPHFRRRALTGLVLEVFRFNGELLSAGDTLVHDLGLTSARWQVLGAIALSPVLLPVAHIARNMGLTRQAVQRVVDDMRTDGLVQLDHNPHHRRALLVAMTEQGEAAYKLASERQEHWADELAAGLPPEAIEAARTLLRTLQQRLDASAARTPLTIPSITQDVMIAASVAQVASSRSASEDGTTNVLMRTTGPPSSAS